MPPPDVEPLEAGCYGDDECPDYNACRNGNCVNPCADYGCAPLATCRVTAHRPICTCPDGYVGSPRTECRPRKSHADTAWNRERG